MSKKDPIIELRDFTQLIELCDNPSCDDYEFHIPERLRYELLQILWIPGLYMKPNPTHLLGYRIVWGGESVDLIPSWKIILPFERGLK